MKDLSPDTKIKATDKAERLVDWLCIIGTLAFGIIMIVNGLWYCLYPDRFSYEDYEPISGKLEANAKELSHHDGDKYTLLHLTNYPATDFQIECHPSPSIISGLKSTEEVTLMIDREDAADLVAGKQVNLAYIYSITKSGQPLYSLNDYRDELRREHSGRWRLVVFGIAAIGVAYWMYKDTIQVAS